MMLQNGRNIIWKNSRLKGQVFFLEYNFKLCHKPVEVVELKANNNRPYSLDCNLGRKVKEQRE